jgi:hypothetical protein
MSSRITYTMTGPQGNRMLMALCEDCGEESPEHDPDPYSWGTRHKQECVRR